MIYSFHPDAEIEFKDAIEYYEGCQDRLGYEFALEVYETVNRVIANPSAWQLMNENMRRSLVNRFPFGIIYVIRNKEILILAVMHLHRKPNYWENRIEK
jgi:hypothetical protein